MPAASQVRSCDASGAGSAVAMPARSKPASRARARMASDSEVMDQACPAQARDATGQVRKSLYNRGGRFRPLATGREMERRVEGAPHIEDTRRRPLRNLRISVTDRCNLRCAYCMPEANYLWLPRRDLLQFEEIDALVGIFAALGVDRIRLTGGEPLLRRDLPQLVRLLAARSAITDLALTTNGLLLADQARALHDAGLRRVTVSLDTL